MVLHHEHSHFVLEKALHDRMSKIYIFQALLTFVKSLIGIFVPIYMYSIGFTLIDICIYGIAVSLIYLLGIPLSIKIINKIGFKYTLLLSVPIYMIHLIIINLLETNPLYFHAAWFTFGIYVTLFWPAFHSEIAASGNNKHRGSQLGTLQIISILFGSLAPVIGGLVLELSSYSILLIASCALLVVGLIPLLNSEDIKIKKLNFGYKDYLRFIKSKKNTNAKQSFKAEGIDSFLTFTFWPIILFLLLDRNFLSLGTLLTIVSFVSVIFIFYYKSFFDTHNKKKILSNVLRIKSFNWFLRTMLLLFGTTIIYFVESLYKLVQGLFGLSFHSIFYNNATKEDYLSYIAFRELYLHSAKVLFCGIVICGIAILGETKELFIIVTLFGILAPIGLAKLREE